MSDVKPRVRNDRVAASAIACPHCGAASRTGATRCWLCAESLTPAKHSPSAPPAERFSFSIATLLLVTTIVAIVCGVMAANLGLGIFLACLLLPVCIKTVLLVRRRQRAGEEITTMQKASMIGVTFIAAVAFLIVAGCAAFCLLIAVCALMAGASRPGGSDELGSGAVLAVAGTVFAAIAIALNRWMKAKREQGELPF